MRCDAILGRRSPGHYTRGRVRANPKKMGKKRSIRESTRVECSRCRRRMYLSSSGTRARARVKPFRGGGGARIAATAGVRTTRIYTVRAWAGARSREDVVSRFIHARRAP